MEPSGRRGSSPLEVVMGAYLKPALVAAVTTLVLVAVGWVGPGDKTPGFLVPKA